MDRSSCCPTKTPKSGHHSDIAPMVRRNALAYDVNTSSAIRCMKPSSKPPDDFASQITQCSSSFARIAIIWRLNGARTQSSWLGDNPMSPELGSGSTFGWAARERRMIHVPDLARDPEYNESPI